MINMTEIEARAALVAEQWRTSMAPPKDYKTRRTLAVIGLLFCAQAIPFVLVLMLGSGCVSERECDPTPEFMHACVAGNAHLSKGSIRDACRRTSYDFGYCK